MHPIRSGVVLCSCDPARKKSGKLRYVQFCTNRGSASWLLSGAAKAASLCKDLPPTAGITCAVTATLLAVVFFAASAFAQEDKKTDDLKPADPDTGESTVEETTLAYCLSPSKIGESSSRRLISEKRWAMLRAASRGARSMRAGLNLAVDVDFEKLAGVRDVTFHANMFQIHGGGLSRGALLNFMDVSGIEALPSTRLYEAWFERKWGTKLALRAGQLAADTEFMTAKYTDVFTNASLGWPAGLSLNLPSGGPSPPLAAVGARLRAEITDNLTGAGRSIQRRLGGAGRGRPSAPQPLRCQLSRQ